jgi:hypothetical protein
VTVLLFAGQRYYARGGWRDFVGEFDSVEAARRAVDDTRRDWIWNDGTFHDAWEYDWAHVVVDGQIVAEWEVDHPYEIALWTKPNSDEVLP